VRMEEFNTPSHSIPDPINTNLGTALHVELGL
jgi:hypothetical protein